MSLLNQQIRVCKEGNYDELYTPRDFVEVLLKYIPKHVKTIWCSCDTEKSEYVKVFKENGYNVIATSLTEEWCPSASNPVSFTKWVLESPNSFAFSFIS